MRMVLTVRLALATGLLGILPTGPAAGQESPPTPTQIAIHVEPPPLPDVPWRVGATVTTDDGAPVTEATVTFAIPVELLGDRTAILGRGTTDATGSASVAIIPRRAQYPILARYGGDADHAPAEITDVVTFPDVATVPKVHEHGTHRLLDPLRELAPPTITATVIALWAVFLGLAWRTTKTISEEREGLVPSRRR